MREFGTVFGRPSLRLVHNGYDHDQSQTRPDAPLYAMAKLLLKEQRARDTFLPLDIFGEGGWDILLDLFSRSNDEVQPTLSDLCLCASSSAMVTMRWIALLECEGLVKRQIENAALPATRVSLTERGLTQMESYIRGVAAGRGMHLG